MEREFSKCFDYIKNLFSRYLNILSAYKIYDTINVLLAPNKVGKDKSLKNLNTYNDFIYFFSTTKEACRCYFLIEIAKFFDENKHNNILTLYKVLDYAEKNILKLTRNNFFEYHKGRKIIPELFKNYKQISIHDIEKIRRKIENEESVIKKLRGYRDQYLAHDDIKKKKYIIPKFEIEKILNLIEFFLKIFYLRLDFSSNCYDNFIKEPELEIEVIFEYLQNWEKQKIENIKNKYK